jgi:UDP:flavonoid glycosyltransferase YjiC (YdhE family)
LAQFLSAGPPPVYIGFGSPGLRQQATAAGMIVEALRQSGLRAVVNLPPGAFEAAPPAAQVLLLPEVPHAWLFARCAALAHHGGAGTSAAGLRAGVPALVIPLATDQFFWGSRVQALGVGPKPLPQRDLTPQRLAQGLLQAAQNGDLQRAAGELGAKIRAEDGLAAAIAQVRSLL